MTEYGDEPSEATMPPDGARGTYDGFSMRFDAKSGEWVVDDYRTIYIAFAWDSKEAEKVEWDRDQKVAQESGCEHGVRRLPATPIDREAVRIFDAVDADPAEEKCPTAIGTLEIPVRGREIS